MITIDNANEYFAVGKHIQAQTWLKFPHDARNGAIESAKRVLSRALGRALRSDEAAYEEGAKYREEFAVYEQALYMLLGTPYGDGSSGDALAVLQGQSSEAQVSQRRREEFSREALKWLGWGGVTLIRG